MRHVSSFARASSGLALAILASAASVASLAGCSKRAEPPAPAASPPEPPAPLAAAPLETSVPTRPLVPLTRVGDTREGSTVVIAKLGDRAIAFVADEDGSAVHAIDAATRTQLSTTALPGRPAQMVLADDGSLLVALRDNAAVAVLRSTDDPAVPLEKIAFIATAIEPVALAMTDDGAKVLVVSAWGHALEAFRTDTRERVLLADLAREPRAVTASSDGAHAFVSHAGAGHVSVVELGATGATGAAANVAKIDIGMGGWTERRNVMRGGMSLNFMIPEPPDGLGPADFEPRHFRCGMSMMRIQTVTFPSRVARQGFAVARLKGKSERVFVPHVDVATGDALVVSSGYGGGGSEGSASLPSELFDIDVIDAVKATRATGNASGVRVDRRIGADACHLPRAAVADERRQTLLVSCIGNRKLIEYDASGNLPTDAVKRSWAVPAGANGVALDAARDQAIVWSQFEKVVSFVATADVAKGKIAPEIAKLAITTPLPGDLSVAEADGRRLFHAAADPRIASDGRACASCHPDGRDDGLVWSSPEGPRQTIALAGRINHAPPYGWRGQQSTVKEHMQQTMKNLKGSGLTDAEHDALNAYLVSMKGPPPTRRELTTEETRGRYVFVNEAACSGCHAEKTAFTDNEVHDVSSATTADKSGAFLAPSLHFVGESGPFFHDGRYATLEELLKKSDGKMGSTAHLSAVDLKALEAYLRTL